MVELKIGAATVLVDERATAAMYAAAPDMPPGSAAEACFLANVRLRRDALDGFFAPLGIDAAKCRGLWVTEADALRQCARLAGVYSFVGEISYEGGVAVTEDTIEFTETDFGFSLFPDMDGAEPVIEFDAELPWLFEPPIARVRYVDKTRLPDKWGPISI